MIRLTRPACPNPQALRSNYKYPENKEALRLACADKCMYCESKVSQVYFGDVEHIKPKDIFPQLEFVWDNLGYVCAKCNNAKSNKWSAATPFVDPFREEPADHLVGVGCQVWHRRGSQRGEYTRRELDLNRAALMEQRAERIKAVSDLYDKVERTAHGALRDSVLAELDRELEGHKEYAMVLRAAMAQIRGEAGI